MEPETTIFQPLPVGVPLPSTMAPPSLPPVRPPRVPERIGHYGILGLLGEGGMGTVYLGEQREPFYRRVALKVIRAGRSSRSYALRFEHERQVLALMNHPGIARVYDAGTTDDGDPYFAMEYVPGLPLTDFCDRERLTMRERLELFVEVCAAIQHAHQRGVLHRDIKPHNVLVTREEGRAHARVIDFGLAKAFDSPLLNAPELTQLGIAVGTPSYMSPEQADRRLTPDIDSRADIYSLGVLLYELLTGRLPLELASNPSFVEQLVREEPLPPSRRVSELGLPGSEIAFRRRSAVPELRRQLTGDLDWIVLKALEKDRERRYATVSELAEDVRRHLRDEAVLAGPPSLGYRLRKLVRRHRRATAAVILMVLGVSVGTAGVAAGLVRSLRAEETARQEADKAREINRMLDEMLASAAPGQSGRDVRVVDVLDRAGERLEREPLGDPEVEAGLRATLGRTYLVLGHLDKAGPQLERALALHTKALGPDHANTLAVRIDKARWLFDTGQGAEAEREAKETVARTRAALGDEHSLTRHAMGRQATILGEAGRWDEGVALIRDLIAIQTRTLGADDIETLRAHNVLARLLVGQGHYPEAEAAARRSHEGLRKQLGEGHPDVLSAMNTLGGALYFQEKLGDLEQLARSGVEIRVRTLGREHPETLDAMNNLAAVLGMVGQGAEAEALHRETLEIRRRVLGPEHPRTLDSWTNVGRTLTQQGDHAEAQKIFEEVWTLRQRTLGKDHPDTWFVLAENADALNELGRPGEAGALRERALTELRRLLGPEHPGVKALAGTVSR
jgi:tetratricopeptide (TPR) repeat protein/predicted Ser/Thr protein kinase